MNNIFFEFNYYFERSKDFEEVNKCKREYATIAPIKLNVEGKTKLGDVKVTTDEKFTVGLDQEHLKEGIKIRVFQKAHQVRSS